MLRVLEFPGVPLCAGKGKRTITVSVRNQNNGHLFQNSITGLFCGMYLCSHSTRVLAVSNSGMVLLSCFMFFLDSEGQGGLACCSPWGHKELDTS